MEREGSKLKPLKAPMPYFGGKSTIAAKVWGWLGDCANFTEPFFGSGAVLLSRPHAPQIETVNDIDGLLCNFWRALQADPAGVACFADWPVSECDLSARHIHLVNARDDLTERLSADPDYYDARLAGWWIWGACAWIGTGWCSGKGPWRAVDTPDGLRLMKADSNAGRGINRQLPHVGDAGQGINRQLPHVGDAGPGIENYLCALSERLRRVRICCGDWTRVLGPSCTYRHGATGVFLDPPYGEGEMDYSAGGNRTGIAQDVAKWAIANGDNPLLRIALCGYEGAFEMPADWECVAWKSAGGYGSQGAGKARDNAHRERIWFSPHCLSVNRGLFAD
jgi:DNA adenine methylase